MDYHGFRDMPHQAPSVSPQAPVARLHPPSAAPAAAAPGAFARSSAARWRQGGSAANPKCLGEWTSRFWMKDFGCGNSMKQLKLFLDVENMKKTKTGCTKILVEKMLDVEVQQTSVHLTLGREAPKTSLRPKWLRPSSKSSSTATSESEYWAVYLKRDLDDTRCMKNIQKKNWSRDITKRMRGFLQ